MTHLLRAALAATVLLAASALLPATDSIGRPYGAREPKTCASRQAPAHGALSSAQAAEYFTCDAEYESGANLLYLVTDAKIQVAPAPRPFNIRTDSFKGVDPKQPVYDIRGSFTGYQCSKIGMLYKQGANCNMGQQPQAQGSCYRDTFGEWHCRMLDIKNSGYNTTNVAPPTK